MSTQNTEVKTLAQQLESAKSSLSSIKTASEKLATTKLIAQLNKLIEAESKGKKVVLSEDASESTTVKDSFNYSITDYSRESITTASAEIIYDTCIVSIIGENNENCIVGVPTLWKHGGQNTKSLGCKYTYFNLLGNYMQGFNRTKSVELEGKTQIILEPSNKVLGIEVNSIVYTNPLEVFVLLKLVQYTNDFNKLLEAEKFADADVIAEKLDTLKNEYPVLQTVLDSELVSKTGTTLLASQVMEQYQAIVALSTTVLNEDGTINEVSTLESREIATKKLAKLRGKLVPIFERDMPKVEPTK